MPEKENIKNAALLSESVLDSQNFLKQELKSVLTMALQDVILYKTN